MPSRNRRVVPEHDTDPLIRDFSLALAAEGKKPKTVKIYTDAAYWLKDSQELRIGQMLRRTTLASTSLTCSKVTPSLTRTTSSAPYSSSSGSLRTKRTLRTQWQE